MGLAQLLAWRLARTQPNTFSLSINDFGLGASRGAAGRPRRRLLDGSAFDTRTLMPDVLASLNSGELAQRRFREIARVAGLVFGGYPGAPKSLKQVQASSSLFWEVFRKYDAGNQPADARPSARCWRRNSNSTACGPRSSAWPRSVPSWVDLHRAEPLRAAVDGRALSRRTLDREAGTDRLQRILAQAQAVLDGTDSAPAPAPSRRRHGRQSV